MAQTWQDVLFLHWPVVPDELRARIPRGLSLDLYAGQAWLTITPLVVTGLRPRGLVPVPGLSTFPETNVRTYVTRDGKPGVWFFSLDAESRLAVASARALYPLPYYRAEFSIERAAECLRYACRRRDRRAPSADYTSGRRPSIGLRSIIDRGRYSRPMRTSRATRSVAPSWRHSPTRRRSASSRAASM